MNLYVGLIQQIVEYIEESLGEEITLSSVSGRFHVSEFHFNRMFRTVTGTTLKQYILGRKLSGAMERLGETRDKVIDIAYDFGFQYPEVFSRAFKKQFGVSPESFRKDRPLLAPVPKAKIVERNIVNHQGRMALKGEGVFLKEMLLGGFEFETDTSREDFREHMQTTCDLFLTRARADKRLRTDRLFALVHCHGQDNGEYAVFYGMEAAVPGRVEGFSPRLVPSGWYERFLYVGDMFDIRESFVDDLYRWVIVQEVELHDNGIGMLNIFREDYPTTQEVEIFVPVKRPHTNANINASKAANISMQGSEPERGDPSGYAFGVKCSATLTRRATQRRAIQIHLNRTVAKRLGFPRGNQPCLREKIRRDDAFMFGIGINKQQKRSCAAPWDALSSNCREKTNAGHGGNSAWI